MSEPYVNPYPLTTFISAEEDGDSMTLTYRTEGGGIERFTFGREGGPHEFHCAMISISGRDSEPDQEVELYLKKAGESGVTIMTQKDAEDVVMDPGFQVTHILRLAVKGHDNVITSRHQLSDFMYGKRAA